MSPRNAKLADTPPIVGSVYTEINGRPAEDNCGSIAVVFAICISESILSCMRAPRGLDAAHKAFANDRSHRPAHKSKFKAGGNGWKSVNGATKHNQRIRL